MIYLSSEHIKDYIKAHPVDTMRRNRDSLCRKIRTPTLGMYEFYQCLEKRLDLFTQGEYWSHLRLAWDVFLTSLTDEQQFDAMVRAYSNFYLSGIDQLYIQGLLFETGLFRQVTYNHRLETSGIDVTATTYRDNILRLQLYVDTFRANASHSENNIFCIKKRLTGKRVGGMFWYQPEDLAPVIQTGQDDLEEYTVFWKTV